MWKKSVDSRNRHGHGVCGGGCWWVLVGVLCVVGLGGGCSVGTGDEPAIPEPEFGLGGKADGDLCDPAADLCWPTDQQAAMRTVFTAQDRLLLGSGDAQANARLLVGGLEGLSVKLTDAEREGLSVLSGQADALSPDADQAARLTFLTLVQDGVAGRLAAHCISAQSVPVGSAAEAEALGKADDFGTDTDPGTRADLPAGVRESLDLFRQSGVTGKLFALMFEQFGGLDDLPMLFEEVFPFSEPREERVQRLLDRYQLAAAGASAIAGAEGLIPVAGIVISFSHKTVIDFRMRARLTLEIATLYGIDVREGLNLFFVASTMMGLFDAVDTRVVIASNMGIRLLANGAFVYGLGTGLNAVVRTFATRGVAAMLVHMGKLGAELAAKAVARTAGIRAVHQVLGYLTLGLSVVVDAAASAYQIGRMGEDAHAAFRPWAAGMTTFSAVHLATLEDRRCAALALGDMITADGTANATEQQLLAAHLGRAAWVDGSWQWFADEAQSHALEAAAVGQPGDSANLQARQEVETCLINRWRSFDAEVRLAVLSDLFTMAAVDGVLDPAELERYTLYESLLMDGVGITNFDLRVEHLDLMRQVITILLVSPEDVVPEDQLEAVESVPVDARLEFLTQVPAAYQAAVTCAYLGTCP